MKIAGADVQHHIVDGVNLLRDLRHWRLQIQLVDCGPPSLF